MNQVRNHQLEKKNQFIAYSEADLKKLVPLFLSSIPIKSTICLEAEMGVGKTTFIQEILKNIGVEHPKGSPTYSIINEYLSPKFGKIYHLDLYRLKDENELLDIGAEDIFSNRNYIFIEWPTLAERLLPDNTINVTIKLDEDNNRIFEWE